MHKHKVSCNWDINYVFMLRASEDSQLHYGTKEINAAHHMHLLLNKVPH